MGPCRTESLIRATYPTKNGLCGSVFDASREEAPQRTPTTLERSQAPCEVDRACGCFLADAATRLSSMGGCLPANKEVDIAAGAFEATVHDLREPCCAWPPVACLTLQQ